MRASRTSGRSAYCVIFVVLAVTMGLIFLTGIGGDAAPLAGMIAVACVAMAVGSGCSMNPERTPRACIVPPSCRLSERPERDERR